MPSCLLQATLMWVALLQLVYGTDLSLLCFKASQTLKPCSFEVKKEINSDESIWETTISMETPTISSPFEMVSS